MICDIGEGSAEIAILSLGDVVSSSSLRVAGGAMDQAIADYLKRHYSLKVSLTATERIRIEIGSAAPLECELVAEVRGVDTVSKLPRKAAITSEEVREALAEPLESLVEGVRATLDGCPPDLAADLVDSGLALAGGASQLRGLDCFFTERIGLPTRVVSAPTMATAKGLLVCLEQLTKWRNGLECSDDAA